MTQTCNKNKNLNVGIGFPSRVWSSSSYSRGVKFCRKCDAYRNRGTGYAWAGHSNVTTNWEGLSITLISFPETNLGITLPTGSFKKILRNISNEIFLIITYDIFSGSWWVGIGCIVSNDLRDEFPFLSLSKVLVLIPNN